MTATTFDQVLTSASALPEDQQEMLESLLCKRRIEAWRRETAAEAKGDRPRSALRQTQALAR